jgi:RNA recognition motif-containing protein
MPVRLFVGNLPYEVTEAEIREHFTDIGTLSYVHLPTDRETGRPRGFAFIEFQDPAQAEEAIRRLNNQPFKGRPLAINEARAREQNPGLGHSAAASPRRTPGPGSTGAAETPSRGNGPDRQFGPDAAPRRNRKQAGRYQKSERGPKRAIRERVGGQFFGGDVEDADDDFGRRDFVHSGDDSDSEENR